MTERSRTRIDAIRNAERIVAAARAAYAAEREPLLAEIAQRAGVGIRTLYRHFPTKEDLLRGCLRVGLEMELLPTVEVALRRPDAFAGFAMILYSMIGLASRERNIVRAAHDANAVTIELAEATLAALTTLATRAQRAGSMRTDIDPEDVHHIVRVLTTVDHDVDLSDAAGPRLLAIILDGLTSGRATPLPGAGRDTPDTSVDHSAKSCSNGGPSTATSG